MRHNINEIQYTLRNNPVLVLNLISDKKTAESFFELAKKNFCLMLMDYYRIPLRKNENIKNVLNPDLKYLNVNFLYLTDNIDKLHFGDEWDAYRSFKKDIILDESLKLYTYQ